MQINMLNKRLWLIFSSVVFLFLLSNTKGFLSPYFIICVMACMFIPYKFANTFHRRCSLFGGAFLAWLVAIANFDTFDVFGMLVVLVAGTFIFDAVIQTVFNFNLDEKVRRPLPVFFISFGLIGGTFLIYLFVFNYPGTLCIDSAEQLGQILRGNYWNHHPVWHTFTIQGFLAVGDLFTGDWYGKLAIYNVIQSLLFAGAISFGVMIVRNTRILFPAILAFIVLPYHMNYAVTMTKDTLFVAGFTVFTSIIYLHIKGVKLNWLFKVLFIASMFNITLYRTNGTIILVSAFIGSLVLCRKRQVILPMICVLGISYFMKYPLLEILHISQPDIAEKTVMLYQQVGRVVSNGGEIDKHDKLLIDKLIPIENISSLYKEDNADSIKHAIRFSTLRVLENNKSDYLGVWFRTGLKNPFDYIEAFVAQTRFWYNGGYRSWVVYNYDQPGIAYYVSSVCPGIPLKEDVIHPYLNGFLHIEPLISVGLHIWFMLIFFIKSWITRDKKILLIIPYIVMVLTLITSAPTMEFRYVYSWFTILPILVPMLFTCSKKPIEIRRYV